MWGGSILLMTLFPFGSVIARLAMLRAVGTGFRLLIALPGSSYTIQVAAPSTPRCTVLSPSREKFREPDFKGVFCRKLQPSPGLLKEVRP